MNQKEDFLQKFTNKNTFDNKDWWNSKGAFPEDIWEWILSNVNIGEPKPVRNPASNNTIPDEQIVVIVKFAVEKGAMEASRKFGIHHGSVYDWCKRLGVRPARGNQPIRRDWEALAKELIKK